jgi:hypothetical protein
VVVVAAVLAVAAADRSATPKAGRSPSALALSPPSKGGALAAGCWYLLADGRGRLRRV